MALMSEDNDAASSAFLMLSPEEQHRVRVVLGRAAGLSAGEALEAALKRMDPDVYRAWLRRQQDDNLGPLTHSG